MNDWFDAGIKMSLFVVVLTGTLLYMPNEVLTGVEAIEYRIPSSFDPWYLTANNTAINKTISQGSTVPYQFSDTTAKHAVKVEWDTWYGIEAIRVRKFVDSTFGILPDWYEPDITLSRLQGSWDATQNSSFIKLVNKQGTVGILLEDTNSTRNNITASWVANSLNCTVIYGVESYEADIWVSRELVVSLLSFKLPSILIGVNPYLSYLISATIYIPIIYIVLGVSIKILRG